MQFIDDCGTGHKWIGSGRVDEYGRRREPGR